MKKLRWVVTILLAATTAFAEPSSFSIVVKGKGRPMRAGYIRSSKLDHPVILAGRKSGGKRVVKEQ